MSYQKNPRKLGKQKTTKSNMTFERLLNFVTRYEKPEGIVYRS